MKAAIEINLEEGMPTADMALSRLKAAINRCGKNQCIVIIHGYGSSGKGGVIRQKVRLWLGAQVNNGKIKKRVFGENFGIFNTDSRELCLKYSGLDCYKDTYNHGITIIET